MDSMTNSSYLPVNAIRGVITNCENIDGEDDGERPQGTGMASGSGTDVFGRDGGEAPAVDDATPENGVWDGDNGEDEEGEGDPWTRVSISVELSYSPAQGKRPNLVRE